MKGNESQGWRLRQEVMAQNEKNKTKLKLLFTGECSLGWRAGLMTIGRSDLCAMAQT